MSSIQPTLHLLGSSHHLADLEVREKINLPQERIDEFYRGLSQLPGLDECLLLNTCNRTEIYGASNNGFSPDILRDYLSDFQNLDVELLRRYSYQHTGERVVRHLFEVTAGIDSQMVGETEILGQVKKAYEDACKRKVSGKILNRLFQRGFQAAKWARTHTGISKGQVNLGNVLCELARRIFGKVENSRLLVVGAGEVAESAIEAFKSRGSPAITVTGRTFEWCPLSRKKPDELAEKHGGFALGYSKFRESLHLFDVILASTSSGKSLIESPEIKEAMSKRPAKPLFLIDASVPRNISEEVADIDNVFLYNMDDVSAIANENLKSRMAEVSRCRSGLAKRAVEIWKQIGSYSQDPSVSNQSTAPLS